MHYMRINFATQGLTGRAAERGGSKVPGVNNAPMGLYQCAPGGPNDYVFIMTSRANPDHWDRLLKLVGREDLIGDARYATPVDRVAREAEVDAVIAAWTKNHSKQEARRAVGEAGIPAGAVLDTMELQNDETFEKRGIMQTMVHPVHKPFKMPGWLAGRCGWMGNRPASSTPRCAVATQPRCWASGSGWMRPVWRR